jgi:hypothetical protein
LWRGSADRDRAPDAGGALEHPRTDDHRRGKGVASGLTINSSAALVVNPRGNGADRDGGIDSTAAVPPP